MIGLIGAMEEEILLLKGLIGPCSTRTIGAFKFFSGTMDGKEVVLLRCGIGKVNAAVGTALLAENYKPAFVINTGSAGGINGEGSGPALKFGDVVISSGLVYHDVDVTAFEYTPGQVPGMPAVFPVPENLMALAEQAVDALKAEGTLPENFSHVRGLTGSGDVFMYEPARIAAAAGLFPGLRAVEMESAAVAHACYLFGIPCLVIRALSDIAGAESPMTHDEFLPVASRNSCEIVQRIVRLSA